MSADEPRFRQAYHWLMGRDTGSSSRSMLAAALGDIPPGGRLDYPLDPDDLGRCVRLLEALPWVAEGFPVLREACPTWAALLSRWDDLLTLYHREMPSGVCHETYELMRALRTIGNLDRTKAAR